MILLGFNVQVEFWKSSDWKYKYSHSGCLHKVSPWNFYRNLFVWCEGLECAQWAICDIRMARKLVPEIRPWVHLLTRQNLDRWPLIFFIHNVAGLVHTPSTPFLGSREKWENSLALSPEGMYFRTFSISDSTTGIRGREPWNFLIRIKLLDVSHVWIHNANSDYSFQLSLTYTSTPINPWFAPNTLLMKLSFKISCNEIFAINCERVRKPNIRQTMYPEKKRVAN